MKKVGTRKLRLSKETLLCAAGGTLVNQTTIATTGTTIFTLPPTTIVTASDPAGNCNPGTTRTVCPGTLL